MVNDTRIHYILVADKLYEVERISFYDFTIYANETDLDISDVPKKEIFDISDIKDFHVKLHNWHGNVVDFTEYVENRKLKS